MSKKKPLPNVSSMAALCAMMDADENDLPPWSASDLSAMLEHLLRVPVDDEGIRCGTRLPFGEILSLGDVPRDWLVAIKDYAKRGMDGHDALPRDVAKALYVAAIVHARVCGHAPISSLSGEALARLERWCLAQGWVPAPLRSVIRKGVNGP